MKQQIYTTLIVACKNDRKIDKCWELFQQLQMDFHCQPDSVVYGVMIRICAATHDAEKAKSLFQNSDQLESLRMTCLAFNPLIKALASRKSYAYEAIDTYNRMLLADVTPDSDSIVSVLKACAQVGDIQTAFDSLLHAKQAKIPMNRYIYNGLLRVYAGCMELGDLEEDKKEAYIKDAWRLFEQFVQQFPKEVSSNMINSLLLVHTLSFRIQMAEELVMPLFDQYQIEPDQFTYQHLSDLYLKQSEPRRVLRLRDVQKLKGVEMSHQFLNNLLEASMKLLQVDDILEVLQEFHRRNREPKMNLLKKLGDSENIPDDVYDELKKFPRRFGFVGERLKRYKKKDRYMTT